MMIRGEREPRGERWKGEGWDRGTSRERELGDDIQKSICVLAASVEGGWVGA